MAEATLFDRDYYAWTQDQAARLRRLAGERANLDLDLENLAEEVESMGASDLRAVESDLANVLAHLLKLELSPARDLRDHWRAEIGLWRGKIALLLDQSPSLRGRLRPDRAWNLARRVAALSLKADGLGKRDLPTACPYDLGVALSDDWEPPSRDGLPGPED